MTSIVHVARPSLRQLQRPCCRRTVQSLRSKQLSHSRYVRVFGSFEDGGSESGDVKKFKVMGMEVLESDESLPEPQQDMWTGENMEGVNTLMKAYLPMMFVAALFCGGIAARFFNDGASVYIRPATSDDALPETFYETPEGFVPAEENPLFK